MPSEVPVEAFSSLPLFVSSTEGRVLFCNPAAEKLFDCDGETNGTEHCWEMARLESPAGRPFCREDCAIRELASSGRAPPRRVVWVPRNDGAMQVELLTFVVPRFGEYANAVLHLLLPLPPAEELADPPAPPFEPESVDLERLTPREREVLRLLAAGLGTSAVARKLYISPVTVRNHVQHILDKLHVHGRLEAILTYLHRDD